MAILNFWSVGHFLQWTALGRFFLKIWPNPGCGFCAFFEMWAPPVKGCEKGIKDFRGAIKSHQRAIKSAQKAIKIPQKRSGAPRDLFSFIGAVRRAFIHLRLV